MTEGTSQTASEPSSGLPEPAASVPTSKDSWPTDPRSLGLDPAGIALHADGDWKPAHHKLLTSLGLAYRDLVNRTLDTVAKEIGQPLNGWDFKRSKGPQQVTIDAENDLKASPWALQRALARFVEDYNHRRYHESLQNVTPADVYHGRRPAILAGREQIKLRTLQARRRENLRMPHHAAQRRKVSLTTGPQWTGLV